MTLVHCIAINVTFSLTGSHGVTRFFKRALTVLVLLFWTQLAPAQTSGTISPSVVLVLKLVSNTLVKPTTGVVISDDGLVLVSADFVSTEGEIIVLDGGTDILTNGRPARVLQETVSGNLAVLSVDGLKRPGIVFSDNDLGTEGKLHLEAFPPAEYIAKGEPPLFLPLSVSGDEQGMQLAVSPSTPLPYVSGAIVDLCGYLAGVSLSSGTQSLETVRAPKTIFSKELTTVLKEMKISPATAVCESSGQASEPPAVLTHDNDAGSVPEKPVERPQDKNVIETVEPGTRDTVESEMATLPPQGVAAEPVERAATNITQRPSLWRIVPLWLILAGFIILAVLTWKAIYLFRIHRNSPGNGPAQSYAGEITGDVQPASDEPVTAPLESPEEKSEAKPRSAPALDMSFPDLGARPEGCDAVLLVEGRLDTQTAFRRFCFINSEKINIVIGRGDTDIAIEHAAISRAHVRLESYGESMTLSDLGSRNGTYIGDVPCLPGEIMYLGATDEIYLGDVKLTIRVVRQEAEWA